MIHQTERTNKAYLRMHAAIPDHINETGARNSGSGSFLVIGILLAAIVLQLFAVPGTGYVGVGLGLSVALVLWALLAGHLKLDPVRCCIYLIVVGTLATTLFFKLIPFSIISFLMLMTVYAPFVAIFPTNRLGHLLILNTYQRVVVFVAWCGILQFAAQFVVDVAWIFPFQQLLPASLFVPDYNLRIPLTDDSSILKSTGIWFLEPSLFAQAVAFAILIELAYFRRIGILLLFVMAYITSFSGTGLLLLAAVAVPLLFRLRQFGPLIIAVVGITLFLTLLPVLQNVPPFSFFVHRLDEFSNPLSSGSMRFFAPYWIVRDVILADPAILWFGLGPGSVMEAFSLMDYATQDTAWLKLLLEYGLVGAMPFFTFYLYVLFHRSPDKLLSFAFLVQNFLLGGYLNSYFVQFLMLAIVGWPRLADGGEEGRLAEDRS